MKVLCNLATKKIEGYSNWDDIAFNPDTHTVLEVLDVPDMELDKLNDTNDAIVKLTDNELAALENGKYIKSIADAIQSELDKAAQAEGYDNIFTAVTYASEPAVAKFQNDGKSFRKWRSEVWDYCYAVLAQYEADAAAYPALLAQYEADLAQYTLDLAQYEIDIVAEPPIVPTPIMPIAPVAPAPVMTPTVESVKAGMPVRS